jgi:hypothetical protein
MELQAGNTFSDDTVKWVSEMFPKDYNSEITHTASVTGSSSQESAVSIGNASSRERVLRKVGMLTFENLRPCQCSVFFMLVCASPHLVRLRRLKPLFEASCKVDREPTGQKQAREE